MSEQHVAILVIAWVCLSSAIWLLGYLYGRSREAPIIHLHNYMPGSIETPPQAEPFEPSCGGTGEFGCSDPDDWWKRGEDPPGGNAP